MVDDAGISEIRAGRPAVTIPWERVERLSRQFVRSTSGVRIHLVQRRNRYQPSAYISEVWRQRQPEQWRRNRERNERQLRWVVYFWYPLLILGPTVPGYLLYWFSGEPDYMKDKIRKLERLTIIGVFIVAVVWISYLCTSRKSRADSSTQRGP